MIRIRIDETVGEIAATVGTLALYNRPRRHSKGGTTMQLTRFTDYSLRTLIYLALNRDRLVIISEIAKVYRVSENHLMKIVHRLAQQGYIETLRGKGGGMRLARQPDAIHIGTVVRHTEENMDIAECFDPLKRDCPMLPECALKAALIVARESFLNALDTYTVADLIANKLPTEAVVQVSSLKKKNKAPTKKRR